MAFLKILNLPDPRLRLKAQKISQIDRSVLRLVDDLLETMYDSEGCGLAANQVGILQRVAVVDVRYKEPDTPLVKMINPKILSASEHLSCYEEGCLSVPGQYEEVKRPAHVKVQFLDENGKENVLEAHGLLATCIQHEIDHLDGRLFIDHLSYLKKESILRKIKKKESVISLSK